MRGVNDRTLMALGGWKSPRLLDRYAHLSPAHLWQAIEGLARPSVPDMLTSEGSSGSDSNKLSSVSDGR